MKKLLFNLRALMLFLLMMVGVSSVWAEEVVVYTLEPSAGSNNSYTNNCDVAVDNVTWNVTGNSQMIPWRIGGKSITKVDRAIYSKSTISDNISKIVVTNGAASNITVNSFKLIVSSEANGDGTEVSGSFIANGTTTFIRPNGQNWSGKYFKFVYNVTVSGTSNKFVEFSKAVFYSDNTGGGTTPEPTKYNVSVANDIANGTVTASPTSATEGTGITLTATPASGYEFGSWNVTNASTSAAITVTDNKFTMPAANVNVSATFNAVQQGGDDLDIPASGTYIIVPGNSFFGTSFTSSNTSTTKNTEVASGTQNGITLTLNSGNSTNMYIVDSEIRVYNGYTWTVSVPAGYVLTRIVYTAGARWAEPSVGVGTFTSNTKTWTGNANSVVFTAGSSSRTDITEIAVTYEKLKSLTSVVVSGTPTKTTYTVGENFNPAGLTVTGTYDDESEETITEGITWNCDPSIIAYNTSCVNVTAKVGNITSEVYAVNGLTINKKTASISIDAMTIRVGEQKTIAATTTPPDAMLIYTITDGNDKVSYADGKLTGVAAGSATIKAEYRGSNDYAATDATFSVTVESALVEPTLTYADVAIKTLEQNTLAPSSSNSNGIISYAIKSGDCVALENGVITATKVGSAVITATQAETATYATKSVDINVTVSKATPTLSVSNITAYVGEADVAPVVTTNNTDQYTVTYSIEDNDNISIVDNKIHAKAAGNAIVTAIIAATDNFEENTMTFGVAVEQRPLYDVTVYMGGTYQILTETAYQGGVLLPDPSNIGDYTFAGWSATQVTEETTDAPTYVTLTDGKYIPTATTTLYAVYTKNKDVEKAGFYISNGDNNYVGEENFSKSGSEYKGSFKVASATSNATTFYFEDSKLFWVNGSNKYYVKGSSSTDIYRVTNSLDATSWLIDDVDGGKKTFRVSEDGRYLGFNGTTKFSNYASNLSGLVYQLKLQESQDTYSTPTPHYTSSPVATTTPSASFAEATKTVVADQTVTQEVKTNSTGAISYSSSDETIASVNATTGEVTGHKYGTVTITANIAEVPGRFYATSATYTVNVNRITTTIKFDDFAEREATTTVYADNEYTFKASTNAPEDDADVPVIVYSLANETYATINSETGKITFKPATADNRTVTAYAKVPNSNTRYTSCNSNTTYAKLTITVKDNRLTQTIAFPEGSDKNFVKGDVVENFTIEATGASTTVTYASDNTSVAEVDENTGEVTVHTNLGGPATITATAAGAKVWNEELGIYNTYNESKATYTITVDNMARPVISVASGNYNAAQTVTLTAEDAYAVVYTLDESDPTYNVKTEEFHGEMVDPGFELTINKNCTLKVIAINNDFDAVSAMAQATYTFNFPAAATTAWETDADIHMTGENYVLTAPEGATISYQIGENEKVVTDEQEVNISFEHYGKYNLTVDVVKNGLTTTSTVENLVVYGFADVPFTYDGNSSEMPLCFYGNTSDYSNSPKIQFKNKGTTQLTLMVNDGVAQLSYDYAFNGTWPTEGTNTFEVEMSIDGSEWETLKTYNTQLTSGELHSETLSIPSLEMIGYHYFRWTYTKGSGNWALGNIKVLPAGPDMTIAGEPIHEEAYVGTQVVKVGAPDAVIFYYTTDGTEPTTDSESSVWAVDYEALINVTESCTLKVVAANDNDEIGASTSAVITIEQPTEATDQNLIFERKAVHFTADETSKIANYEGQSVFGANTTVTYSVVNEGSIVATVNSETGTVRITSATGNGTATITATAAASGNWNAASASYTITVGNLPAPTLQIAGGDFNAEKYYTTEQFADLAAQGGYIAYTITYNDLIPEEALNGDIPGTSSDRVWLPSKYCEASGTYIDSVFEYDDPNDIDITKITIRAVAAMPYIREEGRVKHEEFRAVSDEATFVINVAQTLASKAELQGWKTFYNAKTSFEVDENTSIYIAQIENDQVLLTKVDGRIVDAGNPVLLKTTDNEKYEIHLIETATASGVNWNGNAFDVTSNSKNTGYVLAAKKPAGSSDKVLAFWKYTNLPAGMVYIPVASEAASLRFSVVDEESTGIRTIEEDKNTQEILFNLTGLKVTENKGLMVRDGKVVLVK